MYIRSFADSDGDGVGDLRGNTQHLDLGRAAERVGFPAGANTIVAVNLSDEGVAVDFDEPRTLAPWEGVILDV